MWDKYESNSQSNYDDENEDRYQDGYADEADGLDGYMDPDEQDGYDQPGEHDDENGSLPDRRRGDRYGFQDGDYGAEGMDGYISPEAKKAFDLLDKGNTAGPVDPDGSPNNTFAVHKALKLNPNPQKEDLVRIMDLYHNGTEQQRKDAQKEMLGIMDSYILNIIMTRYYTYTQKHMEDLLQQAYIGVCTGMKTYDPNLGAPTTWFKRYINHELQAYINTQVNHTTQHYSTASRKVMECIENKKKRNLPYTEKDIYLETDVPLKTIKKCLQLQEMTSVSLNSEDSPMELASEFEDPQDYVVDKVTQDHIADIVFGSRDGRYVSTLTKEEKDCIALRFGFDGRGERSYAEIEKITGIARHRLGKIIATAIKKIKFELTKEKYGITQEKVREIEKKRQEFLIDNIISDSEMEYTQMTLEEYFKEGLLD